MKACLDSWAVLAWLDGEQPAYIRVQDLLSRPERPLMSWLNMVECYYRLARDHGSPAADQTLSELRGRIDLELPGVHRMVEAARLKARLAIALAGCFAIATAGHHGLELWTGDPEILAASDLPCPIVDLRLVS